MKLEPHATPAIIAPGANVIPLEKFARLTKNTFLFGTGVGGDAATMSFQTKSLYSVLQTPGAPSSLTIPTNRSISFDGEPLESVTITNSSAFSFPLTILRSEA